MIGMAKYPDKYFDLAVVDPPYGIERFKRGSLRFDNSEKSKDGLKWDIKPNKEYFDELFRISKNQVIWGANNFVLPPTEYFLIWDKQQTVQNFATAEYAWVSMGLKKPAKIFQYSIHKHNQTDKIHPTQKPIQLYDYIYLTYLKEGGKVIDTHLGSGSNRIAADKAGNIEFIGFELDKDYFEAQEKRWAEYKKQLVLW
jgi:site-specific DNA-methyltransferase (adenine-specific)